MTVMHLKYRDTRGCGRCWLPPSPEASKQQQRMIVYKLTVVRETVGKQGSPTMKKTLRRGDWSQVFAGTKCCFVD